jgi:hypothetical protein
MHEWILNILVSNLIPFFITGDYHVYFGLAELTNYYRLRIDFNINKIKTLIHLITYLREILKYFILLT